MSAVRAVRDRRASRDHLPEAVALSEEASAQISASSDKIPSQVQEEVVSATSKADDATASNLCEEWWSTRADAVRLWIASNPLGLGVPQDGCLAVIKAQLERGDGIESKTTRLKCWKHIEIELQGLAGWDPDACLPSTTYVKASKLKHLQAPPQLPAEMLRSPPPVPGGAPRFSIKLDDEEDLTGQGHEDHDESDEPAEPNKSDDPGNPDKPGKPGKPDKPNLGCEHRRAKPELESHGGVSIRNCQQTSEDRGHDASTKRANGTDDAKENETLAPATCAKENTPGDGNEEHTGPSEVQEPNQPTGKPLSQMTMMERQAYWIAKKKETLEARRQEKEKESNNFSFKPNTASSRRSFREGRNSITSVSSQNTATTLVGAHALVPPGSNPSGPPVTTTGTAAGGSGASKWQAARPKGKGKRSSSRGASRGTKDGKGKSKAGDAAVEAAEPAKVKTALSLARHNGHSKDSTQAPKPDASTKENSDAPPQSENSSISSVKDDGMSQDDDAVSSTPLESAAAPDRPEVPTSPNRTELENEPPFQSGEFWWKVEGGRGHHRVRDGGEFQMWSIYRKKDKTRDAQGISMLVGRLEKPPYDEKVIQMMWDTDFWTEETAYQWWMENRHRYVNSDSSTGRLVVTAKSAKKLPTSDPAGSARVGASSTAEAAR